MTDEKLKEVYFDQYCKTCKHKNVKDIEDPCNGCLDHPGNINSHKPVNWEEDPVKAKSKKK